jgi:hypothetical protein
VYIGTQPFIGQNRKLDNIASSFNGTLTTFNLTVSTEPVVASTPYQLFLSLGGVLQEPGVDFTVSGNQVVFTTPPAFGLTFFGLIQGDSIIFNTPSDGSITASKFASTLLIPFGLGTASAPSITFTGDLNNGIYSPGADQLAVTTNGTERMRITSAGLVLAGVTSNSAHTFKVSATEGTHNITDSVGFSVYSGTGGAPNAAATNIVVYRNNTTSRSINAAGTVNASGADYAEYMPKAGNFTITKGDVCGVTSNGLLTNTFADAISFLVKSTNPSYVGGDTWGGEDVIGVKPEADNTEALAQWETDLEAARQKVDRVAFAGQVPVNVTGATPGQYIVPVAMTDGGITGVAKDESDLTLTEYMRAVGKVIAIEDDGRARIIVKVA